MSVAQVIKNEASDYYANLYEVNKTAKYIKTATRIAQITGDPTVSDYMVCTALGAGTYQSPDTISFSSIVGPSGVGRSFCAQTPPGPPVPVGLNPSVVIVGTPSIYNDGFTYNPLSGELIQTFEANRTYQIDASLTLNIDNTQVAGEVIFELYFYNVTTATAVLLASESQVLAPNVTAFPKGMSISGQTLGYADPNSYFYVQLTATRSAPLTVQILALRFAVTVL